MCGEINHAKVSGHVGPAPGAQSGVGSWAGHGQKVGAR
ncbi:uncharacterized protein METZ01_LOCUS192903, partial [marine metagenome]